MIRQLCAVLLSAVALAAPGRAIDLRQRTDVGQFSIYCEDLEVRRRVASLALRTRDEVTALLADTESGRRPIVAMVDLNAPPGGAPVTLRMMQTDVGLKIEVDARVGLNPAEIDLQKQFVRALLLEYMYRRSGVEGGAAYVEPPWWLLDGAVELLRARESGPDAAFFRQLVETSKLPPIENFLARRPDELGVTALAVDRALAMALVQLLLDQPDGHGRLARLLRNWSSGTDDPVAALTHEFPGLAGGAPALQKWWTLNLARFAASDQWQGMAAEETNRQMSALLSFEVPLKAGGARRFAIGEFAEYLKQPGSRAVLKAQRAALAALHARANVLLRPVIDEYLEVLAQLERGKSGGIAARLEKAERLRAAVVHRADEIADYLNWYEATQMQTRSNAFDSYLKMASELSAREQAREGPVSAYLDSLDSSN